MKVPVLTAVYQIHLGLSYLLDEADHGIKEEEEMGLLYNKHALELQVIVPINNVSSIVRLKCNVACS